MNPKHTLKTLSTALLLATPLMTHAAIGPVTVHSYLNDPFAATIVLTDEDAQTVIKQPESLTVSASQSITIKKIINNNNVVLQLQSSKPIQDLIFPFSLNINKKTRNYSAIIDPAARAKQSATPPTPSAAPIVAQAAPKAKQSVTPTPVPIVALAAPKQNKAQTPHTHIVKEDQTVIAIARIIQPDNLTLGQTMRAIIAKNPKAFINGNPDKLIEGASITLPTVQEIASQRANAPIPKSIKRHSSKKTAHSKPVASPKTEETQPETSAAVKTPEAVIEQTPAKPVVTLPPTTEAVPNADDAALAETPVAEIATPEADSTEAASSTEEPIVIESEDTTAVEDTPAVVTSPAPDIAASESELSEPFDWMAYLPYAAGLLLLLLLLILLLRKKKENEEEKGWGNDDLEEDDDEDEASVDETLVQTALDDISLNGTIQTILDETPKQTTSKIQEDATRRPQEEFLSQETPEDAIHDALAFQKRIDDSNQNQDSQTELKEDGSLSFSKLDFQGKDTTWTWLGESADVLTKANTPSHSEHNDLDNAAITSNETLAFNLQNNTVEDVQIQEDIQVQLQEEPQIQLQDDIQIHEYSQADEANPLTMALSDDQENLPLTEEKKSHSLEASLSSSPKQSLSFDPNLSIELSLLDDDIISSVSKPNDESNSLDLKKDTETDALSLLSGEAQDNEASLSSLHFASTEPSPLSEITLAEESDASLSSLHFASTEPSPLSEITLTEEIELISEPIDAPETVAQDMPVTIDNASILAELSTIETTVATVETPAIEETLLVTPSESQLDQLDGETDSNTPLVAKFELAKMYQEMGDIEGLKETLYDLLDECDETTALYQDAVTILNTLSDE